MAVCLDFYIHINAPFLDIFGCARHSPNKFGSALTCTKIALRFSAALGNMSKLYCTRLHENSRHGRVLKQAWTLLIWLNENVQLHACAIVFIQTIREFSFY